MEKGSRTSDKSLHRPHSVVRLAPPPRHPHRHPAPAVYIYIPYTALCARPLVASATVHTSHDTVTSAKSRRPSDSSGPRAHPSLLDGCRHPRAVLHKTASSPPPPPPTHTHTHPPRRRRVAQSRGSRDFDDVAGLVGSSPVGRICRRPACRAVRRRPALGARVALRARLRVEPARREPRGQPARVVVAVDGAAVGVEDALG